MTGGLRRIGVSFSVLACLWSAESARGLPIRSGAPTELPLYSQFLVASTAGFFFAGAQRLDTMGHFVGAPLTLPDDAYVAAPTPDGGMVVVAFRINPEPMPDELVGQRFDASGNAITPEFPVNDSPAEIAPKVSVSVLNAAGDFIVTWGELTGALRVGDIVARRFDAMGTPLGPDFIVNSPTTGDQEAGTVSVDEATGDFVILWRSDDPPIFGCFAQRFDPGGTPIGAPFPVAASISEVTGVPGGFFATLGGWLRRFDLSGAQVGSPIVFADGPGVSTSKVAVDATGDFIVVWEYEAPTNRGSSENGFYARRYDAAGNPRGPAAPLRTKITPASLRGIAVTSSGDFMVVASEFPRAFHGPSTPSRTFAYAIAHDAPISGAKLLVRDGGGPTTRSIVVGSGDSTISTRPGFALDPVVDGAYLHIFNVTSGESACLPLPAAGWIAKGDPSRPVLIYTDATGTLGPCHSVTIKNGRYLKAACTSRVQSIPYTLDESSQGGIAIVLRSGDAQYCLDFGGTVSSDVPGQFASRSAPAPMSCPTPPTTCP